MKWAGGKSKLVPALVQRLPARWNRYFEPFAGGAALFPVFLHSTLSPTFDLDALHQPRNTIAMKFALGWWPCAFALAVSYFVNVFRANRARVSADDH